MSLQLAFKSCLWLCAIFQGSNKVQAVPRLVSFRISKCQNSQEHSRLFHMRVPPGTYANTLCSIAEVTINNYTNHDRLTNFLGCSREILGSSSVLCVSFPLKEKYLQQDEADSPLGLMAGLSRRGIPKIEFALSTALLIHIDHDRH